MNNYPKGTILYNIKNYEDKIKILSYDKINNEYNVFAYENGWYYKIREEFIKTNYVEDINFTKLKKLRKIGL